MSLSWRIYDFKLGLNLTALFPVFRLFWVSSVLPAFSPIYQPIYIWEPNVVDNVVLDLNIMENMVWQLYVLDNMVWELNIPYTVVLKRMVLYSVVLDLKFRDNVFDN